MDFCAGQFVTPNIRLVQLLGKGGMGSVWLARHQTLETDVAVKFIRREVIEEQPSALARFKREAALAAKIKSLHVVQMFDHGFMKDGTPYIVMELLEGESLRSYLDRCGRLSLEQTEVLISQIAKALEKAHSCGVIHRDLKPDNLFLVDSDYEIFVKVLDFGIAKSLDIDPGSVLTSTGEVAGTPLFMSPEQLLDTKNVDFRADLWSLAVIVFVCITGRPPFTGETLSSLSLAIFSVDPPTIVSLVPDAPKALDRWFARALHKESDKRFQTVSDFINEFIRALGEANDAEAERIQPTPLTFPVDREAPTKEVAKPNAEPADGPAPPTLASWPGYDPVAVSDGLSAEAAAAADLDTVPAQNRDRRTLLSGEHAMPPAQPAAPVPAATLKSQTTRQSPKLLFATAFCATLVLIGGVVAWHFRDRITSDGSANRASASASAHSTTHVAIPNTGSAVASSSALSRSSASVARNTATLTKSSSRPVVSNSKFFPPPSATQPPVRPTSTPSSVAPRPTVVGKPTTCPALVRDEHGDWVANPDCL